MAWPSSSASKLDLAFSLLQALSQRYVIPSPVLGVCVWASAGLLVWTGAGSFAGLGVRCPDNGGIQDYLCYCFGDLHGFSFTYVWILVAKPCSMSMIAMIFAEYLYKGLAFDDANMPLWALKGLALLAIGLVTYLNSMGTGKAAKSANVFLVIKISTLGSIISPGFVAGLAAVKGPVSKQSNPGDRFLMANSRLFDSTSATQTSLYEGLGRATEALLAALFAFGGWESIGFVAGEVLDPIKNLPRILNRAMLIVLVLFLLTVTAFYTVLPLDTMQNTNAVATVRPYLVIAIIL
ncbi:MAG: hypothetical protein Q9170_007102 [Blastenia crenularia]